MLKDAIHLSLQSEEKKDFRKIMSYFYYIN